MFIFSFGGSTIFDIGVGSWGRGGFFGGDCGGSGGWNFICSKGCGDGGGGEDSSFGGDGRVAHSGSWGGGHVEAGDSCRISFSLVSGETLSRSPAMILQWSKSASRRGGLC